MIMTLRSVDACYGVRRTSAYSSTARAPEMAGPSPHPVLPLPTPGQGTIRPRTSAGCW